MSAVYTNDAVRKIAQNEPSVLADVPAADRFRTIAHILKHDFGYVASSVEHRCNFVLTDAQESELNSLSLSFSHSSTFIALAKKALGKGMSVFGDDDKTLGIWREWDKVDIKERKRGARAFLINLINGAIAITNCRLDMPKLTFFKEAADDQMVDSGSYVPIYSDPERKGEVIINIHEDAGFDDASEAAKTIGHEFIHVFEDQMCQLAFNMPVMGKKLEADCKLWRLRDQFGANMPYPLGKPYENQYHERVAYSLEEIIPLGLHATL